MVYIKAGEGYPDYSFDEKEPVRFEDVVKEYNGLPLSSRDVADIDSDISMAIRVEESYAQSLYRRKPKRYESRFVVEYLDELDYRFNRLAKTVTSLALQQIHFIASQQIPEQTGNT